MGYLTAKVIGRKKKQRVRVEPPVDDAVAASQAG